MFTGIIQELGKVKRVFASSAESFVEILAPVISQDLKIGDSVAVNGVCLTAVEVGAGCFKADVMPETFKKTNLSSLKSGDKVNLELALRASDRLGGHFVLGHVDQVGVILDQRKEGNAMRFLISAPREIKEYLAPKGSIAVDGVSLTILEVHSDSFAVSIIPHTAEITTLGAKHKGDRLNLEADIIGKYVNNMMGKSHGSSSTAALLNKYGYLDKGGA